MLHLLAVLVGDDHRDIGELLNNFYGFFFLPILGHPSWTFGDAASQPNDDEGRDHAKAEHPPPRCLLREDQEHTDSHERTEQHAHRLQGKSGDEPAPPVLLRQHLGEVGRRDRVIQTDGDAQQEAEGNQ